MVTDITMNEMMMGLPVPDNDIRVVMFFGATCGPCQATRPHYESTAKFFTERTPRIKFFRINAWEPEEQKIYCVEKWGVQGVPHFKIFCRGEQLVEKITPLFSNLQCIVSNFEITGIIAIPFGKSQEPSIFDFADNVNTLDFLQNI